MLRYSLARGWWSNLCLSWLTQMTHQPRLTYVMSIHLVHLRKIFWSYRLRLCTMYCVILKKRTVVHIIPKIQFQFFSLIWKLQVWKKFDMQKQKWLNFGNYGDVTHPLRSSDWDCELDFLSCVFKSATPKVDSIYDVQKHFIKTPFFASVPIFRHCIWAIADYEIKITQLQCKLNSKLS